MDFEGILKFFRVNLPKKFMEEEQYKQLMNLAIGIKVSCPTYLLLAFEPSYWTIQSFLNLWLSFGRLHAATVRVSNLACLATQIQIAAYDMVLFIPLHYCAYM